MEQPGATRYFSLVRLRPVRELIARFVLRGEAVERLYDPRGTLGDELPADRFLDRLRSAAEASLVEAPFVTEALLDAYRRTSYVALLPGGEVRVRIGEPQPALEGNWAFVTAENPGSFKLPADLNASRTRDLETMLHSGQWISYPARAIPDQQEWDTEHGFLVRDITPREALDLGRSQGQNAIVFASPNEPARLVLCFPG